MRVSHERRAARVRPGLCCTVLLLSFLFQVGGAQVEAKPLITQTTSLRAMAPHKLLVRQWRNLGRLGKFASVALLGTALLATSSCAKQERSLAPELLPTAHRTAETQELLPPRFKPGQAPDVADVRLEDPAQWSGLRAVLERSASYLSGDQSAVDYMEVQGLADPASASSWVKDSVDRLLVLMDESGGDAQLLQRKIGEEFVSYPVVVDAQGKGEMQLTFSADRTLEAKLRPDAEYRYPILARPAELDDVRGRPRHELVGEDGTRVPAGITPIAYARSLLGLYALQFEGSGVLKIADAPPHGQTIALQIAADNDITHRSLGSLLREEGGEEGKKVDSWQGIEAFFADKSAEQIERYVSMDPALPFFEPVKELTGNTGIPRKDERMLATDHSLILPGAPLVLQTRVPGIRSDGAVFQPRELIVVNGDIGGSIRGARAGLYLGAGEDAFRRAAVAGTDVTGQLSLLLLKERPAPGPVH
jgi:membrane-bound lytic murein transglycosylase